MQVINATRPAHLPLDVGWHNWEALFTDSLLWQPVVNDIFEALGLAGSPQVKPGYPGTCAVFVVEEQYVLKLFPPMVACDQAREHLVYQLLEGKVRMMPRLLASGTYRERLDWPFLIFSFVPGTAIRDCFEYLSPFHRQALAREVGLLLRQVQATAVPETSLFEPWPEFLARRKAGCLQELRESQLFDLRLLKQIDQFLNRMEPELRTMPAVLLHADLTEDHVFVVQDQNFWRLTAVIDWADAQLGPPQLEWVAAWFGLCRQDPRMFQALVAAASPQQGINAGFWRQMLALTFLHTFGPLIIRHQITAAAQRPISDLIDLQAALWAETN